MGLLLLVAFLAVPIAEIAVINQVQQFLGWPTTILILVLNSIVGAYLVRMQGALAWRRFTEALGEMRVPTEEIADGALILLGGALLLTPGFLTDAVGLAMVFTPTRRAIGAIVRRRITASPGRVGTMFTIGGGGRARRPTAPGAGDAGQTPPSPKTPPRRPTPPGVIDVEVLDVQRNPRDPDQPGAR